MPRTLKTLVGRLTLLQLVIHAVLTPILYYRLDTVVRTNTIQAFTHHARAYAQSLASELKTGDVLDSPSRTVAFLDGSVEGGSSLYAAIEFNGRLLGSSVTETPGLVQQRGDDVAFGNSPDNLYAVSVPILHDKISGTLYLGFDERPTLGGLRSARAQIIAALIAYAVLAAGVAVLVARLVSRPITQLQELSRRVASGDSSARLGTDSTMTEIVNLSNNLEFMRGELVGTAARLRTEMQEREAAELERAILESQLRHRQRLATVGTFAGGLAHEFNNILVPLLLYTEEALDEIDVNHPARANLERVVDAATRASSIIAKLLAFSHPTGHREPQAFDLAVATGESLDLSEALIPANVELHREIHAPGERVFGDPTLWNQVILNLCSNAVHAMRAHGGILTAKVSRGPTPQTHMLECRIQDTGGGMSPETQERIFEPFFTTREVGEGSGLGLSVVHGIIASMGGTIRVVSMMGAGTEFIIELPALSLA
jgi:signal transduction histidine kinase